MATCTPQTLMDDAGCFACLTPDQLQVITASILCKIAINSGAMATCDTATLMSDAKCFACLTPQQLQIVQTQLLCEIYTNGLSPSGGGVGSILCGTADPTDAPTTTCAFYYRTDNGGVWYWNSTTSAWVQLIAP